MQITEHSHNHKAFIALKLYYEVTFALFINFNENSQAKLKGILGFCPSKVTFCIIDVCQTERASVTRFAKILTLWKMFEDSLSIWHNF